MRPTWAERRAYIEAIPSLEVRVARIEARKRAVGSLTSFRATAVILVTMCAVYAAVGRWEWWWSLVLLAPGLVSVPIYWVLSKRWVDAVLNLKVARIYAEEDAP